MTVKDGLLAAFLVAMMIFLIYHERQWQKHVAADFRRNNEAWDAAQKRFEARIGQAQNDGARLFCAGEGVCFIDGEAVRVSDFVEGEW